MDGLAESALSGPRTIDTQQPKNAPVLPDFSSAVKFSRFAFLAESKWGLSGTMDPESQLYSPEPQASQSRTDSKTQYNIETSDGQAQRRHI